MESSISNIDIKQSMMKNQFENRNPNPNYYLNNFQYSENVKDIELLKMNILRLLNSDSNLFMKELNIWLNIIKLDFSKVIIFESRDILLIINQVLTLFQNEPKTIYIDSLCDLIKLNKTINQTQIKEIFIKILRHKEEVWLISSSKLIHLFCQFRLKFEEEDEIGFVMKLLNQYLKSDFNFRNLSFFVRSLTVVLIDGLIPFEFLNQLDTSKIQISLDISIIQMNQLLMLKVATEYLETITLPSNIYSVVQKGN